jgi:hypothetical protein
MSGAQREQSLSTKKRVTADPDELIELPYFWLVTTGGSGTELPPT